MKTTQLRRYVLVDGEYDAFVDWWGRWMPKVRPAAGFTIEFAYGLRETNEFVWAVSAEGDELRLRGDVVASTTGSASRPVKMTTEQLNVFPDSKRATSAVAVTVTQPGSILRGLGMEALLDSRRVRLKSNVRVRYVPPHR